MFLSILLSLSTSLRRGSATEVGFTKSFSHGFTFTVFNATVLPVALFVPSVFPVGFSDLISDAIWHEQPRLLESSFAAIALQTESLVQLWDAFLGVPFSVFDTCSFFHSVRAAFFVETAFIEFPPTVLIAARPKALLKDFFADIYNDGRCIFAFLSANAIRELLCFNFILSSTNCSATIHGVDLASVTVPGILICFFSSSCRNPKRNTRSFGNLNSLRVHHTLTHKLRFNVWWRFWAGQANLSSAFQRSCCYNKRNSCFVGEFIL